MHENISTNYFQALNFVFLPPLKSTWNLIPGFVITCAFFPICGGTGRCTSKITPPPVGPSSEQILPATVRLQTPSDVCMKTYRNIIFHVFIFVFAPPLRSTWKIFPGRDNLHVLRYTLDPYLGLSRVSLHSYPL